MQNSAKAETVAVGADRDDFAADARKRRSYGLGIAYPKKHTRKSGKSPVRTTCHQFDEQGLLYKEPFIKAYRHELDSCRATALGALRRQAPGKDKNTDSAQDLCCSKSEQKHDRALSRWNKTSEQSLSCQHLASSKQLHSPPRFRFCPKTHEIVRNVSGFVDEAVRPCDEFYVDAFVDCLESLCVQNDETRDEALPKSENSPYIDRVFPTDVARRYSPDFIKHLLRHINLSRRGLAAALVYLDRAQALCGKSMTVCNENVNTLVLCACVIALRMTSLRGYSDDIIAMISGMKNARELRLSIAFFLGKLSWDGTIDRSDTVPYEIMLDRFRSLKTEPIHDQQLERIQIESRNRVLKLYYPPSIIDKRA